MIVCMCVFFVQYVQYVNTQSTGHALIHADHLCSKAHAKKKESTVLHTLSNGKIGVKW